MTGRIETIAMSRLDDKEKVIKKDFLNKKPFRYTVVEDFLYPEVAEKIHKEFPEVDRATWVDAGGLQTRRKWTQPVVERSTAEKFYEEVNSDEFRAWLSQIVGIKGLLADPDLQGAGLHQTLEGGYLNVHVDFNKHHREDLDRRLNLIVFLCKHVDDDGSGYLELWDMDRKLLLESVAPVFNRAIVFETNEISFHGHPNPWKNAAGETRKSLSVYYYTEGREDGWEAPTHNTVYVNTEGFRGRLKTLANGLRDVGRLGPLRRRLADRHPRRRS